MKKYICSKLRWTPAGFFWVFIFAIISGVLAAPPPACAQTYGLRYQMWIGSTDNGTQNDTFESGSGLVQSTNLLTATFSAGTAAYVAATPSASYGQLHLTAVCGVDCAENGPNWDGNGHLSRMDYLSGAPVVFFQDTLTVTSATLPAGTPVKVQIICQTAGYITPGFVTGMNGIFSSAAVGLNFANTYILSAPIGGANETNFLSAVLTTTVGASIFFIPTISALAGAVMNAPPGLVAAINTEITSKTYVNVLTPDAGYVADSGAIYPGFQMLGRPALSIQANNNTAVISWPSVYADYVLEQNSSLDSTNWVSNTDTASQADSQFHVAVSPLVDSMFYRLKQE